MVAAVNKEPHQPVAEPAPADSDPFGGDDAEELADAEDVPVEVEKKPMAKEQPPVKAPEVEKKPTAKEQPPVKAPEVEKKKAVEERPTPVPAPTANPLPPPQPPVVKEKEQQPKVRAMFLLFFSF